MNRLAVVISISLLFLSLASCSKIDGKGDVVTNEREVTGYSAIGLSMDADVSYSQDTAYSLILSGQQNILDELETVVQSGKLVIKYKDHVKIGSHDQITVVIRAPGVNILDISGSGNMRMETPWNVHSASLNISGSGNISLPVVETNEIEANISGSGNIMAYMGSCSSEQLTISGSGNIDMLGVEADTAYATISGSGNIMVTVSKYLNATISGSGSVFYFGNPIIVTNISGSGTVSYTQPL